MSKDKIEEIRERLKKQQYGFAGRHTAVKICTWTKKSLKDEDVCYKQKFYGIKSHLCCQMSPAVNYCQNSCIFCWRSFADTLGFDFIPKEEADDPKEIIDKCIEQQRILLSGFGGNKKVNMKKFKEAQNPKHFAISLTGEPTLYPYLKEFIEELHKRKITTFLVSNGLKPDVISKVKPTQLYISLDAPNEELYLKIDRPKVKNAWQTFLKTLRILKEKKEEGVRTVIRITLIKGINDVLPEKYAELIKLAEPLFVEVKAYMHVGYSIYRLKKENMPSHEEVVSFSKEIEKFCDYKVIDEKKESRVTLMMRKQDYDKRFLWDYANVKVDKDDE